MVEVKVKVKVKVSGQKGQKEPAKKTRKPRKDKGVKRGKRTTRNPQFQTGSIDFRTIGTQQTSNATLLAGLISSRAVVPQYLQPQQPQQTSTELTTYAPRDLPRNVPPAQFRADTEQAQEETPQSTQVRQKMGKKVGRLEREIQDLEEKEAVLYIKTKGLERRNMQMEEQGKKLQEELTANSKKLVEQQDLLSEQRKELLSGVNAMQTQGLSKLLKEKGVEPVSNRAEELRKQYLDVKGLREDEDYKVELKKGRGGGVNIIVPIEKQELQRAQEERPPQMNELQVTEAQERFEEEEKEEIPRRKPKPYRAEFIPSAEYVETLKEELKRTEEPRLESEIEKALQMTRTIQRQNEMEELAKTATPLDSRLEQRLSQLREREKTRVPIRSRPRQEDVKEAEEIFGEDE